MIGHGVVGVRVRGLWAGVDIDPAIGTGREVCEALMARGVLAKDTHGSTIRLAPPLVISPEDLIWGLDQLAAVVPLTRAANSTVSVPQGRERVWRAGRSGERLAARVTPAGSLAQDSTSVLGHGGPAADHEPGGRGVGEQLLDARPR